MCPSTSPALNRPTCPAQTCSSGELILPRALADGHARCSKPRIRFSLAAPKTQRARFPFTTNALKGLELGCQRRPTSPKPKAVPRTLTLPQRQTVPAPRPCWFTRFGPSSSPRGPSRLLSPSLEDLRKSALPRRSTGRTKPIDRHNGHSDGGKNGESTEELLSTGSDSGFWCKPFIDARAGTRPTGTPPTSSRRPCLTRQLSKLLPPQNVAGTTDSDQRLNLLAALRRVAPSPTSMPAPYRSPQPDERKYLR